LRFDKGDVKAVLTSDGEARAKEFTMDGIYMPHVKNTFHEIFDCGEFVFLSGHFEVSFDNGGNKGSFEGNMSNLMKRSKDGKLLIYRHALRSSDKAW
jgi:ketosteroid isomerase-like protein